jgi:hypothetical protein
MVTFKSMPPRTQWAIERLLKATKSEGITAFQLGYSFDEEGNVGGHASVFDADEKQWFYWLDDGEWLAGSEVE